jgi:hypothetical protein
MKNTRRALLAASVLAALPLIQGCATKIKASSSHNPAPPTAFSTYGRIEVKPVAFKPGYQGNAVALAKIGANLNKDLAPSLEQWNKRPDNGRTLTIEPIVEELSYKNPAKRVLFGPLSGSSGVLMRVTFRDQSGKVIAKPEFFQRANAMSAGFAMGVNDSMMLTRVAKLASSYIIVNYDNAVGGASGADAGTVAAK